MQLLVQPRQWLIPGLLLLTVVAAIMAPPEAVTEFVPQKTRAGSAVNPGKTQSPRQASIIEERQSLAGTPVDIFYQENQEEKAANETRQQQARQAQLAPPLPYLYMGRQDKSGEQTVFLTRADTPYVVKAGDVLDGQYRVDLVRADAIQFTYLPLAQKQILNIGMNP